MRVVSGSAGGIRLEALKGHAYRPTSDKVKEALFNILGEQVLGSKFLDLYAGTGGIGIEALSRGADACTFVERSKAAASVIEKNLIKTGLAEKARIFKSSCSVALTKLDGPFDFIFLDPPYQQNLLTPILKEISKLSLKLLSANGIIILEASKREEFCLEQNLNILRRESYGDTLLYFLTAS